MPSSSSSTHVRRSLPRPSRKRAKLLRLHSFRLASKTAKTQAKAKGKEREKQEPTKEKEPAKDPAKEKGKTKGKSQHAKKVPLVRAYSGMEKEQDVPPVLRPSLLCRNDSVKSRSRKVESQSESARSSATLAASVSPQSPCTPVIALLSSRLIRQSKGRSVSPTCG
ncbi:hypothetical protein C8Q76DRAFT_698127 [Earliella scabrosa]|nr:hypothetical protein C8Q76DRAFT_698127 [Earliella scabrosa]